MKLQLKGREQLIRSKLDGFFVVSAGSVRKTNLFNFLTRKIHHQIKPCSSITRCFFFK